MAVTIHDVARAAAVSAKTVSNVVNGSAPVSESTRQRVCAAVHELGYKPDLVARTLRRGSIDALTLLVPDQPDAETTRLAHALIDAASGLGLQVVHDARETRSREARLLVLDGPRDLIEAQHRPSGVAR